MHAAHVTSKTLAILKDLVALFTLVFKKFRFRLFHHIQSLALWERNRLLLLGQHFCRILNFCFGLLQFEIFIWLVRNLITFIIWFIRGVQATNMLRILWICFDRSLGPIHFLSAFCFGSLITLNRCLAINGFLFVYFPRIIRRLFGDLQLVSDQGLISWALFVWLRLTIVFSWTFNWR